MRKLTIVCALVLFPIPQPARAENWTEFRGPTGQGSSSERGLPTTWSEQENVRWKVPIPGRGWSSPVYFEGRIYLTTAVPEGSGRDADQSLRTLCLDATGGEILWNQEVFHPDGRSIARIHKKNSHASPTPVINGEHLYVHFGTNGTACLTLDGRILWRNNTLRYAPQHGSGGSPILCDDLLILSCDGSDVQFVTALDRNSGQIRWRTERPAIQTARKFSFGTPLLIDVDGRKQVVSPGTDAVVAYEPRSGEEIWSVSYQGYSVVPRPVFGGGMLYVCSGFDQASLLAIRPTGRGDVTGSHVEWSTNRNVPLTSSPLFVNGDLYMISDNGVLSCLDAKTGELKWRERVPGNFSASPLFADLKIYLQNEEGETTVIRPGPAYQELARNQLDGATLASIAVGDSALFIRTADDLYRIQEP